jgi:ribosome-associated toxin RatA of RatAB toxin-antitoxin module
MTRIAASSTAEISVPLDRVWDRVAAIEDSPEWQAGVVDLRVLERDDQGRVVVCESQSDAKVRTLRSVVRVAYHPPTRLTWTQEEGDLKSVEGSWELEKLGARRTRATFRLAVDPGWMLAMIFRGPIGQLARDLLVRSPPQDLKRALEEGEVGRR